MANTFITRASWGARPPKREVFLAAWSQRNAFFTHYSAGPPTQSVREIQNFHMDGNNWADIGYNFLVDIRGNKYEGRQGTWLAIGAHAANNNTRGIGVCVIGRNSDVTDAAKRAVREIYDEACQRAGRQLQKLGHRDVNATGCPGDNLWNWVHAGMPFPDMTMATGDDEMKFVLVRETGSPHVWISNMMFRVPVSTPAQLNNIIWQTSANGWWPNTVWNAGAVAEVPPGQLGLWGPDLSPVDVVPVELTEAQIMAIAAAAEAGAAAGNDGASPEEVKAIIDEQLDQAFTGGADSD
jgi:hypothetical protein